MSDKVKQTILKELENNDGILQLYPCWVSREYLPSGKRLGLKEHEYKDGERGEFCERWIVSETQTDNTNFKENEGQSRIKLKNEDSIVYLYEAINNCREELFGNEYSSKHEKLNRLLKIFDYKTRLFYHIHQKQKDASKVGLNSKDEAYYFLDSDLGAFPVTFFGIHPSIYDEGKQEEIFLPYLKSWQGDSILKNSRGYMNVPGEGFHLEAGILHAPGTALTLELQESSDIMAVFQANIEGIQMSKEMLYKDISEEEVVRDEEKSALSLVDWEASADPYFYENHHLSPVPIHEATPDGVEEVWVWYNSTKFNGTRITMQPGTTYVSKALGVHGVFVWKGKGKFEDFNVKGQEVSLTDSNDEFLVSHEKAIRGVNIINTGNEPLVLFKFFGPDINNTVVPMIQKR